jgi:uncharacterized protein YkwD
VPTAARRLASPILAAVLGLSIAGPVAAAGLPAFDAPTLLQARTDLVTKLNDQRVAHGLVALQVDPKATAMAADRAETMASTDTLGHAGPDGRTTFDAIRASGMTWFGAGEVIAWNTYPTESESTARVVSDWLASAVHESIMLSSDYNYVGFGAAVSATGIRYYAGVFLKLPDRTAGWAKAGPISVAALGATTSRVTVRWTGGDTRLQVLTAGLRDFEVQWRLAGGAWRAAVTTTRTSLSVALPRGQAYEFRIRARDKAGNRGAWSSVSIRI